MFTEKSISRRSFLRSASGITGGFMLPTVFKNKDYFTRNTKPQMSNIASKTGKIPVIGVGNYGLYAVNILETLPLNRFTFSIDPYIPERRQETLEPAFIITGIDNCNDSTAFNKIIEKCMDSGYITNTIIVDDDAGIPVIGDQVDDWVKIISKSCDSYYSNGGSIQTLFEYFETIDDFLDPEKSIICIETKELAEFLKSAGELEIDYCYGDGDAAPVDAVSFYIDYEPYFNFHDYENLFFQFTVEKGILLDHVKNAIDIVAEHACEDANILYSVKEDNNFKDECRIKLFYGKRTVNRS